MSTPRPQQHGFTLLELLIVLLVIAIAAGIAIPNLLAGKANANETAAIATLKLVYGGQNQLKSSGVIDGNSNGNGEYGYFTELSGKRPVKTGSPPNVIQGTARVSPPTISEGFGTLAQLGPYGYVARSGYCFVVSLPLPNHNFAPEPYHDQPYPQIDPALAEGYWSCHAWPANFGNTGNRIFFVNQGGVIMSASNRQTKYSGTKNVINLPGVLLPGKSLMTDSVAVNKVGNDGNLWTVVQ